MGTQVLFRSPSRPRQGTQQPIILVVEDDDSLRDLLCMLLADEYLDYHVVGASCGPEALALVRELGRPCFLLLDYELGSRMNGIDLYDVLHVDLATERIPAIMLSGRLPTAALQERCIPSMSKPFELDALLANIAGQLAGLAGAVPACAC